MKGIVPRLSTQYFSFVLCTGLHLAAWRQTPGWWRNYRQDCGVRVITSASWAVVSALSQTGCS